jgi:predicted amidohydrolase YtcJ
MRIGRIVSGAGTAACLMVLLAPLLFAGQTVTVPARLVEYPDTIMHSGKIVTMDDPSFQPTPGHIVQAMAVRDGKVLALGSDAEVLALAGPKTEKLDLRGRTVVPGMIDTHTHVHDHFIRSMAHDGAMRTVHHSTRTDNRRFAYANASIRMQHRDPR